jgi:hypothetical protein
MKKLIVGSLLGFVVAAFILTVSGYIDLRNAIAQVRSSIVELAHTLAGEDILADVLKTESRFNVLPLGASTSKMSTDTLIKNGPGLLKRITCWSDATASAGNIKLLDNTVAGAGNVLFDFDVLAIAYLPFTIEFDTPFSVGLYFDVTTTADMFCQVGAR